MKLASLKLVVYDTNIVPKFELSQDLTQDERH